jgi:serine/threonine protein kinase
MGDAADAGARDALAATCAAPSVTPAESPSSIDLTPGVVLDGRYRLEARIGRGGFGDVWRASEILPDGSAFREVALKLLEPSLATDGTWVAEAKMLASLRHPSLVTIYAAGVLPLPAGPMAGSYGAAPFVAMELLLGETLADVLASRGPVPWRRALRWAREVAAALDAIHVRGVIHLDLKPSNLFLTQTGAVKVLDFGIARHEGAAPVAVRVAGQARKGRTFALDRTAMAAALERTVAQGVSPPGSSSEPTGGDGRGLSGQSGTTAQRFVVGTPGYIAPEMLRLEEPTSAADAYALASLLAELVTGELPQSITRDLDLRTPEGRAAWWTEIHDATLSGKLRELEHDPAGLPRGLVALLRRLLASRPAERGVSPGGLGALLEQTWQRPHGVPDEVSPGLSAYGPEHEGLLFGRRDDVARLVRELEVLPTLILHGERGVGTTSLVRSGVVPELARRAVDDADDWVELRLTGPTTLAEVAAHTFGARRLPEDGRLQEAPTTAAALFAACAESPIAHALVVDQLVARLTRGDDPLLAEVLGGLARARAPRLRVLATLDDAETSKLAELELADALRPALRFIGPPATATARELVSGPLEAVGAGTQELGPIVRDVQRELGHPGALPFVSLALAGLSRSVRAGEPATTSWAQRGGVPGTVIAHADRVLRELGELRGPAEEVLLRLALPSRAHQPFSRVELEASAPLSREAIEALVTARLVVVRGDEVSLAHPALAGGRGRLGELRIARAVELGLLDRVRESAIAWERSEHSIEHLLAEHVLRELEQVGVLASALTPRGRELVLASKRRARRRKLARVALGLTVAALVVLGVWLEGAVAARERMSLAAARDADERAYLADVLSRARRVDDPYARAAWLAEALRRGADGPDLALEIAHTLSNVPHATFLSKDAVSAPIALARGRFIVAAGPGSLFTLADLEPPGARVIEGVDIEQDPIFWGRWVHPSPVTTLLDPGAGPAAERVALPGTTSFAVRSLDGTLRLFRIDAAGHAALALELPLACKGAPHVAARAPVVACATDAGLVAYDARSTGSPVRASFAGAVLDVSPDGEHVLAALGRRAALFDVASGGVTELMSDAPIVTARFRGDGELVALASATRVDLRDVPSGRQLHRLRAALTPARLAWDERGLDLAVCGSQGEGRWHYLRVGGRSPEDVAPTHDPCGRDGAVRRIVDASEAGELGERHLGMRSLAAALELHDGRVLTRDLALLDDPEPLRLLHFRGRDEEGALDRVPEGGSLGALVRAPNDEIVVDTGGELRVYAPSGARLGERPGRYLGQCADRVVGWRVDEDDPTRWLVLDAHDGEVFGAVPRHPGLVLGIDGDCRTLVTQTVTGELLATSLAGGAVTSLGSLDGYVFDVKRAKKTFASPRALLLAVGSGRLLRLDERAGGVAFDASSLREVARAVPRSTALAPWPDGGVVWADATGVWLRHPGADAAHRVLEADALVEWTDLAPSPDGRTVMLAAIDRLAVADVARREIVGSHAFEGLDRLSPWDSEGSLVAWSYERVAPITGLVIPRSEALSRRVAESASNLTVRDRVLALVSR